VRPLAVRLLQRQPVLPSCSSATSVSAMRGMIHISNLGHHCGASNGAGSGSDDSGEGCVWHNGDLFGVEPAERFEGGGARRPKP
jgi:hypothetical protein